MNEQGYGSLFFIVTISVLLLQFLLVSNQTALDVRASLQQYNDELQSMLSALSCLDIALLSISEHASGEPFVLPYHMQEQGIACTVDAIDKIKDVKRYNIHVTGVYKTYQTRLESIIQIHDHSVEQMSVRKVYP